MQIEFKVPTQSGITYTYCNITYWNLASVSLREQSAPRSCHDNAADESAMSSVALAGVHQCGFSRAACR